LDISSNQFGVSGSKAIARVLKSNKHLKILNVFANIIDVDGARAFK